MTEIVEEQGPPEGPNPRPGLNIPGAVEALLADVQALKDRVATLETKVG